MLRPSSEYARALVALLAGVLACGVSARAAAQESGGSFGGSHFGGGGGGGGGGGSSFGGGGSSHHESSFGGGGSSYHSSSSSHDDSAARRGREQREQRAEEERRREEERAAAQRRRDEERRLAEEAARREAAEVARVLALPPAARVREVRWSEDDGRPLDGSLSTSWSPPSAPVVHRAWTVQGRAADPRSSAPRSLRGPPNLRLGAVGGGVAFVFMLGLLSFGGAFSRRLPDPDALDGFAAAEPLAEVRRVSLALDWTARRALQRDLATLAKSVQTSSRGGLASALAATRGLLESHAGAVRYAGWRRAAAVGASRAEAVFNDHVVNFRARYRVEAVRNATVGATPELRGRANEGEGLVVVSIIVAAAHELPALPAVDAPEAILAALRSLALGRPDDLWALEVIWSPAAENDRLSSAELEVLYPELARTDGRGDVGRLACRYCSATYPAELGACPACGAPRA